MATRICWRCRQHTGYLLQSAQHAEALCEKCLTWQNEAALLFHGPISNAPALVKRRGGRIAPSLSAYPQSWQHLYTESCLSNEGYDEADAPQTEAGLRAANALFHFFTRP